MPSSISSSNWKFRFVSVCGQGLMNYPDKDSCLYYLSDAKYFDETKEEIYFINVDDLARKCAK
jgi:hypothetical protein